MNTLIIKTDEDYEISGEVLDALSQVTKAISGHYDDEVARRHREHKEATHARSALLNPINRAAKLWKDKMGDYAQYQEERIAKEQKLVDEEANRKAEDDKINLAAELEKAGDTATAHAVIEDTTPPIVVAPKIVASKSGASVTKAWKGEVTDIKALILSVASGGAPVSLIQVNESALAKFAVATSGQMEIQGVRFYPETKVGRVGKRK